VAKPGAALCLIWTIGCVAAGPLAARAHAAAGKDAKDAKDAKNAKNAQPASGLNLDQMLQHTLEKQQERQQATHPATKPAGARPKATSSVPARKRTPAQIRTEVEALLSAPGTPPNDADLAAFGIGVEDALIAIGRDDALPLQLRARAVSALAHTPLPTTATRLFLTRLLAPRPAPPPRGPDAGAPAPAADPESLLLRRAIVALGTIGGSRVPDVLAPLLSHSDPNVRADAAIGLALTRLPKATEYLRARLAIEPDGRVRGHIARQLNVIDGAVGRDAPAQ
jgi:hypothetical protein